VHLTTSPVAWYVARAGGVVAYALLTAAVLLGMMMSSRRRVERWPRIAVEDVHRFTTFAAGAFVAIHVAAIAIDAYLPFSVKSLVVPFVARYRPAWVGLGVVAAELMLAIAITNRLRNRVLPYSTWRKLHYATFAVWAAATAHGIGSGTDRSTVWLVAIQTAAAGAVVGMLAWRVLRRRVGAGHDIGYIATGAGAAAATLAVVLALGPFKAHTRAWNAAAFSDGLSGQISRRTAATRGIVSLAGRGSGTQNVLVRADLLIAPARLLDTSFQMEYLPSGDVCRGRVTQIAEDGLGFDATCRLANGGRRFVRASWLESGGLDLSGGTLESTD
jgi:methionine sulfoxide reductase heme-binding subunit